MLDSQVVFITSANFCLQTIFLCVKNHLNNKCHVFREPCRVTKVPTHPAATAGPPPRLGPPSPHASTTTLRRHSRLLLQPKAAVTLLWRTLGFWAVLGSDSLQCNGIPLLWDLIRNHPSVAQNLSVRQSSVTAA